MMSISLEQLIEILASVRISSSCEEEILTVAKSLTNPLEENNELTFEESCTSNEEQLFQQEIEEDKEKLQHDLNQSGNNPYESLIERWFQWFQANTRLDQFHFSLNHTHKN